MSAQAASGRVLALCGGIGGAKLALGLSRIVSGDDLVIAVNTGDDFEHLGLHISPDIDTVLYTLGGLNDVERGWGRAGETWQFMGALAAISGETWFNLGDKDLALHVERTRRLKAGERLSDITADVARAFGIAAHIVPASDHPVRTMVETDEGVLAFQRYFVGRRCEPKVQRIRFQGAIEARAHRAITGALTDPDLRAVIVCPSNPYLSVDPILAIGGLRRALQATKAPVIVVSPLIGGLAVKGPTAKIMAELGIPQDNAAIAAHYRDIANGLVIDSTDAVDAASLKLPVHVTATLMKSLEDRERLARDVLGFADAIRGQEEAA